MILVDTSVWVQALRRGSSAEALHLKALLDADQVALCGPVRIELLGGASAAEIPRLRRVLSALPVFLPTPETWKTLESWVEKSVRAGQRFGAASRGARPCA